QGNLKSQESRLQKDRGLIVPKDKERNKILIDVREFRKDGQVIVKFIGKRHLVVEGVAGNKSKQNKNDPENRISRHFYLPKDVDLRTLESVRIKSSEGFLVLHIPSGKPRLDLLEVTIPILNDKTSKPKIFGRTKILKKNDNKNENITRTRKNMDSKKVRHHHLIKRDTNMPEIQDPVFNGEDSEGESVVTIIPIEHREGIFYRATVVSQPWSGWKDNNNMNNPVWKDGVASLSGKELLNENNVYKNPSFYCSDTKSLSVATLLSKNKKGMHESFCRDKLDTLKSDKTLTQNSQDGFEPATLRDNQEPSKSFKATILPVLIQPSVFSSDNDVNNYRNSYHFFVNDDALIQPSTFISSQGSGHNFLQPYQYGDDDVCSSTETFTTQCHNGGIAATPQSLHSELQNPKKRQKINLASKRVTFANGFIECSPVAESSHYYENITTRSQSSTTRTEEDISKSIDKKHSVAAGGKNTKFLTQSTIFVRKGLETMEDHHTTSNILSITMNSINTKHNVHLT
ncbi:unnamed protein product, partial [Meganyctiphanes norvegica]